MVEEQESKNEPQQSPLNRREFLKLGFLGLAGTGVLALSHKLEPWIGGIRRRHEAGIDDWETDLYAQIDFAHHPEHLVNNPELVERIKKDLVALSITVDGLHGSQAKSETEPFIDPELWKQNAENLVEKSVRWAQNTLTARARNFQYAQYEVTNKYFEIASYLQTVLVVQENIRAQAESGPSPKDYEFSIFETLGDVIATPETLGGIQRTEIEALWPYDWGKLMKLETATNPVIWPYFSPDGGVLDMYSNYHGNAYFPHREFSVERDTEHPHHRPKEVVLLHFDPDVQEAVMDLLRSVGLERGMATLSWYPSMYPEGWALPEQANVGGERLAWEDYKSYHEIYNRIILHEAYHVLNSRSMQLPDEEQLWYRDILLKVTKRFDPLARIDTIFNPQGDHHVSNGEYTELMDYLRAHKLDYMKLTNYYFTHLDGFREGSQSVHTFFEELRLGIFYLADTDILQYLWPAADAASLQDVLKQLRNTLPQMDGVSRIIASTILENTTDIETQKRSIFRDYNEIVYFIQGVLPYVVAHLALYHPEKLFEAESTAKNPQLLQHFLQSWQKRFDRFVKNGPVNELTADIFSYMLLDSEKRIEWGETLDDFAQILALLKRNGLAFRPGNNIDAV